MIGLNDDVPTILETELRVIYGDRFESVEIQSVMKYPMRENKYIVIYNLDVKGALPIIRAKIVVDTVAGSLEQFDPAML
ncbi:hypothetical protein JXL21_08920 [Candidatus Bathyarchaeota archaeon]|nr:hypothetical protein [Candidatus Bathyarchaeota archaeon]